MINWLHRLHLRTGLVFAVVLPGIFAFSLPIDEHIFARIFYSFAALIGMWISVFALIDFRPLLQSKKQWSDLIPVILLALFLASAVYLAVGAMDFTGLLLMQIKGNHMYSAQAWAYLLVRLWIFCAFIIVIKYLFDSTQEKKRKEKELEILRTEGLLALNESLKQQISPHFLFNSLNTLKSLVKQNSPASLTFIDELSAVYRYMLSHYGKNQVTIIEEIEFVRSYLSLLKTRFGDALQADIEIPPGIYHEGIPPNTLQILMENAVKHNILTTRKPLHISVSVRNGYLEVSNNLQPKPPEGPSSHVGLSNINNRYALLKGREIVIERDPEYFRVKLPIQ